MNRLLYSNLYMFYRSVSVSHRVQSTLLARSLYGMNWLDPILLLLFWTPCAIPIEFTEDVITGYREKVKKMFYHAYDGYLNYAYPLDELMPITCTGHDTWGSFSLSLIDALDTLVIMGNQTEFLRAVDLILETVRVDANVNVSVFETNIRVVGGLLSAHMLSGRIKGIELEDGWPCSGPLLRLAEEMALRLLPAFNTDTGMPFGTVNLRYGVHRTETPITCTAGVGTFILEFGVLSRLTGNPVFERTALKAMESLWETRSPIGLVGNHINVQTSQWTATDSGIGAGVDSYFEYLVKGGLLFQRPSLIHQFREYATSINKHVRKEDWFMWVSMSKGTVSMPIFQSLEAFWPGLLTLVGDVEDASRIMMQYAQTIKQYGFPPEFYNIPNADPHDKRAAYPLRPEIAESLMYLYRATEDPTFLEIGAQMIDAIEHSAKTKCGYATINNVNDHSIEDRMESFFLAETTKYLYLLFDPDNFIHNDGLSAQIINTPNGECVIAAGGYIFNTEAHPIDPAMMHCCSAQKQEEREILQKWQADVDLTKLFDNDKFGGGSAPTIDTVALEEENLDLKILKESKYLEKQYGSTDLEFEVEVEEKLKQATEGDEENEAPEEIYLEPEVEKEEQNPQTPEPTGIPEESADDKPKGIKRAEVVEQIRVLIRKARLLDEEKRDRGEQSNVAEKLVTNLRSIYEDYADLVDLAKKLDDMDAVELKKKAMKRAEVAEIPVVDAECLDCCYPMEFIEDSMVFRIWQDILYETHFYPKWEVPFEYGPVCRPWEEPRIEDNYLNEMPKESDLTGLDEESKLPGSISLLSFNFDDVSHLGFNLLSSPPLDFYYKFIALGQLPPRRNGSWYYHG